jgi:hypothetical protein
MSGFKTWKYEVLSLTSENYMSGDPTFAYDTLYGPCGCEFCSATREGTTFPLAPQVQADNVEFSVS